MNDEVSRLYNFTFRGLLAEEALDNNGRQKSKLSGISNQEIAKSIGLELLDDAHISAAKRMAVVFSAIAAFENTVRDMVKTALMDKFDADWWEKGVSSSIRDRAQKRLDSEQKVRWHTQRGSDPLNYTTFGDLKKYYAQ